MVIVDANILLLMLDPAAKAGAKDDSGQTIDGVKDRVEYLIERLDADGEKVAIPAPVLGEALVFAGADGPKYVEAIKRFSCFEIVPFDEFAAIEVAQRHYDDKRNGDKFAGTDAPWQKVKIDRQVLAIATVVSATTIYCDDGPLRKLARDAGMDVVGIADLPLRPLDPQGDLLMDYMLEDSDGEESEEGK